MLRLLALCLLALSMQAVSAKEWLKPRGKWVLFENHRLYYHCEGAGEATVLIDGGIGDASANWLGIQAALAPHLRVCVYDRAGYGMSDPGPGPRSSARIVRELHRLTKLAGISGPYIIVGQSFGGFTAQLFARLYPQETRGIVLVDSSHPRQTELLGDLDTFASDHRILVSGRNPYTSDESDPWRWQWQVLNSKRKAVFAQMEELKYFGKSAGEVLAAGPMPPLPVAVLTRERELLPTLENGRSMEAVWRELQAELAAASRLGWQKIVPGSGHNIHLEQPAAVVDAVLEIHRASR